MIAKTSQVGREPGRATERGNHAMSSSQVAAGLAGDGHPTIAPVVVKTRLVAPADQSRSGGRVAGS